MFLSHQASGHEHNHTISVAGTWWLYLRVTHIQQPVVLQKLSPLRITRRGQFRYISGKARRKRRWKCEPPCLSLLGYLMIDNSTGHGKSPTQINIQLPWNPDCRRMGYGFMLSLIKLTPYAKHPACQWLLTWKQAGQTKSQEHISRKPGTALPSFSHKAGCLKHTALALHRSWIYTATVK